MQNQFDIGFSGICIRFMCGGPVVLPPEFLALRCDSVECPDAVVEILPLEASMTFSSPPICNNEGTLIYETCEGQWRVYPLRRDEHGAAVPCLLGRDGNCRLYYPASLWNHYTQPLHCMHLIGVERFLLRHRGFLLHSSVVSYQGRGILFVGPSGAGKSTQAALWERHLEAQVLNGDWCVVRNCDGVFYGGGSPCAGHSLIYRSDAVPVAGVILLEQSNQNEFVRLGARAVPRLMSQILVNSWDVNFMDGVSRLLQQLLEAVPCYLQLIHYSLLHITFP